MDFDISHILKDWPYEHGQIAARKIRGPDGTEKIQLRLDMGLLQMELAGRPDGQRPHGFESLMDYYQHETAVRRQREDEEGPFFLDEKACELLRNESVMYYHRYLAEFILEDYAAVVRDATRNLRVMDLCAAHARERSDRHVLEQYRPYVVMMQTRARGLVSLHDNRPKAALAAVREGIDAIRKHHDQFDDENREDESGELAVLQGLLKQIQSNIPADPIRKAERALAQAVRDERYEEAAQLRDKLRTMQIHPPGQSQL